MRKFRLTASLQTATIELIVDWLILSTLTGIEMTTKSNWAKSIEQMTFDMVMTDFTGSQPLDYQSVTQA